MEEIQEIVFGADKVKAVDEAVTSAYRAAGKALDAAELARRHATRLARHAFAMRKEAERIGIRLSSHLIGCDDVDAAGAAE